MTLLYVAVFCKIPHSWQNGSTQWHLALCGRRKSYLKTNSCELPNCTPTWPGQALWHQSVEYLSYAIPFGRLTSHYPLEFLKQAIVHFHFTIRVPTWEEGISITIGYILHSPRGTSSQRNLIVINKKYCTTRRNYDQKASFNIINRHFAISRKLLG